MSLVRILVARRDWCASRRTVSVIFTRMDEPLKIESK
jgi:hypothetical protein